MRRLLILAALVPALAACEGDGVDAPGGVSPGEAEALEDAADMLDERRLPPEALPPEAAPTGAVPAEAAGDAPAQSRQ
ncbi:hypothetical protein J3454_07825 [Erythrobacter sp. NFXS35]|uniref:hypothetical protein n=1 Tax=Erythrobacter sp. NFXS35 TaxID=2818436 RepID=UPI0032DED90E